MLCFITSLVYFFFFFFSSRRRHTRFDCDWSSDVCSSDLVDGLHVQGVAEDEGDPLLRAEIGQPVPREDAFHGHHEVLSVCRDGGEEVLRSGGGLAMGAGLAFRLPPADGHTPRLPGGPPAVSGRGGGETPPP